MQTLEAKDCVVIKSVAIIRIAADAKFELRFPNADFIIFIFPLVTPVNGTGRWNCEICSMAIGGRRLLSGKVGG